MKLFFIVLLIVSSLITACNTVNSSSSFAYHCLEYKQELHHFCVDITADQEVIKNTGEMPFTIIVTSDFDEPDMNVVINALQPSDLRMIKFPNQEIIETDPTIFYWTFGMKAGEKVMFKGVVDFENRNYLFEIQVNVGVSNEGLVAANSLIIFFDGEIGQVIEEGMSIPTQGPAPATVYFYTDTPGPFPTWAPSATWPPQIATREALTQQAAKTPKPEQPAKP